MPVSTECEAALLSFRYPSDRHYVGSTTRILEDRLDEHNILNPKSAIYKYRNDNPTIELICLCPCKDKNTPEKN